MSRRAPEGGYNFPAKRQYRRAVWADMRRFCAMMQRVGMKLSDQHALLMPSTEGYEVEHALRAGFRQEHLHIVDKEKAIVATVKRSYPRVETYGALIGSAGERVAAKGVRVRVANLDLCSQVSMSQAHDLDTFIQSGCLEDYACVAVTMQRGREQRGMTDWLAGIDQKTVDFVRSRAQRQHPALTETDWRRLIAVGCVLQGRTVQPKRVRVRRATTLIRADRYASTSGTTFLFGVYWLSPAANVDRQERVFDRGVLTVQSA